MQAAPIGAPAPPDSRPRSSRPAFGDRAARAAAYLDEAHAEGAPRISQFDAAGWEITPPRARHWAGHGFAGFRGDSRLFRLGGALDASELVLLMWDLDAYGDLLRKALQGRVPAPPPLHEYLRPGREHWGCLAVVCRILSGAEEPDGDGGA